MNKIIIPSSVRGLVFDCDGTIADTMPLHFLAWRNALGEYGQDISESLFYEMAGAPTRRIMEILNEKHGYHLPVDEATELKERLFEQLIPQVTPIEPVMKLVHEFAGKLPMAVATGGTRATCTKTLAVMDLLQYFQAMVTADDVEHGKPAPDIFLEAARRLGIAPALCYAFEDADLGVQSARAAGMHVIDIRPIYHELKKR